MADGGFEHLLGKNRPCAIPAMGEKARFGINERAARRVITIIAVLAIIVSQVGLVAIVGKQSGHFRQAQIQQLSTLLRLAGSGLEGMLRAADTVRAPIAEDLERLLPEHALTQGRIFIIVDADGRVQAMAGTPPDALSVAQGEMLPDVLRRIALAADGQGAIVAVPLPGGVDVLAGAMPLSAWPGAVLAVQPHNAMALVWEKYGNTLLGIALGLMLILVMLLALYNWQADQSETENAAHMDFVRRLESALQLGRCGLWDWDVAHGRIFLTLSMCELLGLQMKGGYMDLADFLVLQHPEDTPIDELLEQRLRTKLNTFEHELRLRNEITGSYLWVKLRGALPEGAGENMHLVGIAVDITEQKKAAEARHNAEQQLDQAIESISESFALWDAEKRLVKCNSKFREFYQLDKEICQPGRRYTDIMQQARSKGRRHAFRHALDGVHGKETVLELELDDGRWLQISEQQTASGGHVSVGTDITELKRKQLELETSRRELEETVQALEHSQQEIEFKNQRLRQMARNYQKEKERAERALRVKSQILANVSHELNTPLNHVIGYADVMRQQALGPLDDKYLEYAAGIHRAGEEIHRKIMDIMAFSELSTEKLRFGAEPANIGELALEVAEKFMPQAEDKGLELVVRTANDVHARVDAARLAQALEQLLSNAVRFTEQGEVHVRAEMLKGDALLLEVRDTGAGMPQEMLEHIGEPFQRAGHAYNAHKGGSGIGLAIVKAVAEMHGGRLEIDSAEGHGTCVRIIIPRMGTQIAAEHAPGEEASVAPANKAAI